MILSLGRAYANEPCTEADELGGDTLTPLAELAYAEEDVATYEPYGTAELGAPDGVESDGRALSVRVLLPASGAGDDTQEVSAQIGRDRPDDYRSGAEDEATLAALVPNAYAVTATATGYDVARAVVLMREGEAVQLTITLEPLFLEEAVQ